MTEFRKLVAICQSYEEDVLLFIHDPPCTRTYEHKRASKKYSIHSAKKTNCKSQWCTRRLVITKIHIRYLCTARPQQTESHRAALHTKSSSINQSINQSSLLQTTLTRKKNEKSIKALKRAYRANEMSWTKLRVQFSSVQFVRFAYALTNRGLYTVQRYPESELKKCTECSAADEPRRTARPLASSGYQQTIYLSIKTQK